MVAQRLARTVAAACVLWGALAAASCGSSPEPGEPEPTAPTTPVAGGNHYRVVDDLCAEADLSALAALLPFVDNVRPHANGSRMYCLQDMSATPDLLAGNLGAGNQLSIIVTVYDGGYEDSIARNPREWFENALAIETQAVEERGGTLTPLSGLGQDAFIKRRLFLGTQVFTYDGDATFQWNMVANSGDPLPEEVEQALIESLRATMQALLAT